MPSAFNSLFKSSGSSSRRGSVASGQSPPSGARDSLPQAGSPIQPSRSLSPSVSPRPPLQEVPPSKAQRSLPPLVTRRDILQDPPEKSHTVPTIELVSPSGNSPKPIFGPGDSQSNSEQRRGSPSLGEIGEQSRRLQQQASSPLFFDEQSPPSEEPTPIAKQLPLPDRSEGITSDSDQEDPLFSVKKLPRKMPANTGSRSGTGSGKKGKNDIPDRHDIMRRAMVDATSSDIAGHPNPNTATSDPSRSLPNTERGTNAPSRSTTGESLATGQSHGSIDKPGLGSLSIDQFSVRPGNEEIVLADGSIVSATNENGTGIPSSATPEKASRARKFPHRPKLGSRNNSFHSDMSGEASPDHSISGHGPSSNISPTKTRAFGHGKYATTGSAADPIRSKQTSLAVPGTNGTLDAASDERHHMHESASTGSLLHAPLNRIRRLSDSSSGGGKKNTASSGGIASALAASGVAGMGVGHADLLRRSQANLESEAQEMRRGGSRSRTSSVGRDFVGASQGGTYRDPKTGKLTERGPDETTDPFNDPRLQMLRSRSGTANSSFSFDGSDVSAASGLNAAADFARGLHHDEHLFPPDSRIMDSNAGQPELTPNGIGAVGGLSPSGLGERVALGEENENWHSEMDTQITGFAVASSKRNADFHALFPNVLEDDYLIEDYGCALVREILIQGRLYVSENHVCFYANIFGWVTNIVLPFSEIVSVEKRMTAYVIPNAIQVATLHSKHTFASFLSRDTTYDLVVNIWKLSHPALPSVDSAFEMASDEESVDVSEQHVDEKTKNLDGGVGNIPHAPTKISKRKMLKKKLGIKGGEDSSALVVNAPELAAAINRGKSPAPAGTKRSPHRRTTCICDREKAHLATLVLDTTYPTVPEKLYNLIFTSGFMKGFWSDNQKLMELQMSDWAPSPNNNNMLSRDISYIKPLAGGFGPKQTKCLLTDDNVHVDFDEYVTTMTTTRTPEVPSGNSFSVKTRTCITWAGGNVSRMYVTCNVDWTGRSMVKGIIDRASIDGQKQYYKDLDQAIRGYIKEHASEFREEGDDAEAEVAAIEDLVDKGSVEGSTQDLRSASQSAESKDGFAKLLRTFQNAGSGALDLVSGAFGTLNDMLGGISINVIILGSVVVLLILSNLWAYSSGASRDPLDPHRLRAASSPKGWRSASHHDTTHTASSAEGVAFAVRDALREYFEPHVLHHIRQGNPDSLPGSLSQNKDPSSEIKALLGVLDDMEKRTKALRDQLKVLESQHVPDDY